MSQEKPAAILLVEDDESLRALLSEELEDAGHRVSMVSSAEAALELLARQSVELVISDLRLSGADGLTLLDTVRQTPGAPGFIIITAFGTVSQAVEALKRGADDFLTKPVDLEHLGLTVRRVLENRQLRHQLRWLRRVLDDEQGFHGILGRSLPMQRLFENVRQVAHAAGPVLITGESGVGKELVARALHLESAQADGPFVAVNCAGIPPELFESEFFGHTAGAFTGAQRPRKGLFEAADGGMLLLDEIGEMPLPMQAKLLRILQDGAVRPVGGNREQQVNVRIIAATNRDLHREVDAGAFREDLFYRLETFSLPVPPLRERGEDLDLLTAHFIDRFSAQLGRSVRSIDPAAMERLRAYPFPGNVRELRSAIERAVVFCQDQELRSAHLPQRIRGFAPSQGDHLPAAVLGEEELPSLDEIELRYIRHVLARVDGNKRRAAAVLGIGRRTLYRRLGDE